MRHNGPQPPTTVNIDPQRKKDHSKIIDLAEVQLIWDTQGCVGVYYALSISLALFRSLCLCGQVKCLKLCIKCFFVKDFTSRNVKLSK